MTMNLRDQLEGSKAIDVLNDLLVSDALNTCPRGLYHYEREAIRTLIRIAEAAATLPKPESNVTHFYREF